MKLKIALNRYRSVWFINIPIVIRFVIENNRFSVYLFVARQGNIEREDEQNDGI